MKERAPDPNPSSNTRKLDADTAFSALAPRLRPELFKALGDHTRLEVLGRLICVSEPQTVSEIADCCGVHLSGVSRHLAILRDAGVIRASKRGREVLYELDREVIVGTLRGLADAIDACRESCCGTDRSTSSCSSEGVVCASEIPNEESP